MKNTICNQNFAPSSKFNPARELNAGNCCVVTTLTTNSFAGVAIKVVNHPKKSTWITLTFNELLSVNIKEESCAYVIDTLI